MRISTKIITGYAILIGIIAALVTYHAVSARRMQDTLTRLSSADFRAGRLSLELMRDRDLVEEYAGKSLVLKDPDYAGQLQGFIQSFDRVLAELRSTMRSPKGIQELDHLSPLWNQSRQDLTLLFKASVQNWPARTPPSLESRLQQLRAHLQELHLAILEAIDSEVDSSRRVAGQTRMISLSAAALALVLSSFISFFIVRSITRPLRQLTAGTRAVSNGRFTCHLDTSARDEFSELARDFNSMTRRLSELDTLKKDFVSHVSHELKSPLASMQDNIRLLLDQIPGPLTEKQKRLLGLNLQSAQRLSAMIFNLLDISRIEAGAMRYEIQPHDLADLVRTAVAETESRAREQQLSVRLAQPETLPVQCDHNRILQVVENLLDNAIKFSPRSGTIEVSVSRMSGMPAGHSRPVGGNAYAVIVVADQGPGVPDAHKEKIFEKFHQTSKTVKMAGQGVGLGLAIARTIVEAHDGAIWVEDNPGGGSRFVVLLPSGEAGHPAVAASAPI